nr:ZFHX3-like protein [Parasacculina yatsui]
MSVQSEVLQAEKLISTKTSPNATQVRLTTAMAPEDCSPSPGPQVPSADSDAGCIMTVSPPVCPDVQPFDGKIVYNSDGSAYIIDSPDDEQIVPASTESLSMMDGLYQTGVTPKIATAFYISRTAAAPCISNDQDKEVEDDNQRPTDVPVVHSYRVFSAREEMRPPPTTEPTLNLPMVDYSTVPIKPILMCFVCKLSFGSVKTFVSHAMGEHGVSLNAEEKVIFCQPNTSAILVSGGRNLNASISFLEPMKRSQVGKSQLVDTVSAKATDKNQKINSSSGLDLSVKYSPMPSSESVQQTVTSGSSQSAVTGPVAAQSGLVSTVTGTTIGACPQHMNGRPADEECMECDQIMSFTRSLGGQMAMMHSRNSCKTLKCPKCNWHYKYQETLEIHMKEKHPETETTCVYCITGQPHPRLARGETYTCGYKPYRCEVCNYSTTTKGNLSIHMQSDKHLNNMQELQNGGVVRDPQRPPSSHGQCVTPQSRSPIQVVPPMAKPKQSFRCDVCNYETNVARNLRIHMTSEKHTHNILVMQQNVKQLQLLSAIQAQAAGGVDPAAVMQLQAAMMSADKSPVTSSAGSEVAMADLAYSQTLMYQMMAAGSGTGAHSSALLDAHSSLDSTHAERLEPPNEAVDLNPVHVYTCCTCSCFSTDSIEEMVRHLSRDRSQSRDNEVMIVAAGNSICKLCSYKTNLKANFQLHCKTDKHLQKLQHLNHIFEGGASNEWKLRYLNLTNPVQLRCNICEFFTNSIHKLQVHSSQQQHEISLVLFTYLRRCDERLAEPRSYSCVLCQFSTCQKLPLLQHIRGPQHLHMEQLRQFQRQAERLHGQDEISAIFPVQGLESGASVNHADFEAPFPNADDREEQARGENSDVSISFSCPSCGEQTDSPADLTKHLVNVHKTSEELVKRILTVVCQSKLASSCTADQSESNISRSEHSERESIDTEEQEAEELYRCQNCSLTFGSVDELCHHQREHDMLDLKQTPHGYGYLCSKKGCNQFFVTVQQIETHFREVHAKSEKIAAVSERHVYKYRCSQCSLAFKTIEKLQHHSQYHLIRDASKCSICDRNFRSVPSLFRHLETAHSDIGEEELEKHKQKLLTNPFSQAGLGGQITDHQKDEEAFSMSSSSTSATADELDEERDSRSAEQRSLDDRLNSPVAAEEGYNDPERKFKCHRCRVAYTRHTYLVAHNKTLLHRKGEKLSYPTEKYLDPNRPFKCDVCKESFTQKNILLVHYNSVSHLHKLKKSLQENQSTLTSESAMCNSNSNVSEDETKLYKCNICRVAYSQSQNLDVHIRSVLHQSRVARVPELIAAAVIDTGKPLIEVPAENNKTEKQSFCASLDELKSQETTSESCFNELPSCSHCSAVFITSDQLQQHQKHYCSSLSINSSLKTPPNTRVDADNSQNVDDLQSATKADTNKRDESSSGVGTQNDSTTPTSREDNPSPCFSDHVDDPPKTSTPFRKLSHSHKRLLQNFGFEVVMQYNESLHRQKKRCVDNHIHTNLTEMDVAQNCELPDMFECQCNFCGKTFSNIWILKVHNEECHNNIVPHEILEGFAEKFKKEFYKKYFSSETEDSGYVVNEESLRSQVNIEKQNHSEGMPSLSLDNQSKDTSMSTESQCPTVQRSISPPAVSSASTASLSPHQRTASPQQSNNSEIATALNLLQAAHMHQQMHQMNPLMMAQLASMGFPVSAFNPALTAMNLQPPLMPMVSTPQVLDPMTLLAAQAQVLAQQQQQQQQQQPRPIPVPSPRSSLVNPMLSSTVLQHQLGSSVGQQQKRARTRITDDQLKILRAHFDINNSPSEDQINKMAHQTGLVPKVIKHWFRNTLFKERQRNKDSPYNFNVPPATTLNLEEYEKTGEAKVSTLAQQNSNNSENSEPVFKSEVNVSHESTPMINSVSEKIDPLHGIADYSAPGQSLKIDESPHSVQNNQTYIPNIPPATTSGCTSPSSMSLSSMLSTKIGHSMTPTTNTNNISQGFQGSLCNHSALYPGMSSASLSGYAPSAISPASSISSQSKRANRTRFTDYQIKVLQEFFENNAYPKDDDLEYLSKLLGLSPRVIVVWFQNARQKARKTFENQAPAEGVEDMAGRFQLTAGLNYQCKKCMMVFQRYYELIRHQKQHCYKDENAKKSAQAQAAATQVAFAMSEDSNSDSAVRPMNSTKTEMVEAKPTSSQVNQYSCDKCPKEFECFDLWREHQVMHLMNPAFFQNTSRAIENDCNSLIMPVSVSPKRRASEDESEHDSGDAPRDKHLRTIITPEQLDFLYKKYQVEPNPSRKMLESIALEIGLRKRVVQVWFQNTRARGRKGQFRAHTQVINKRCVFCPAIFKVKSALESHMMTKHGDQYSQNSINIDALPDLDEEISVKPYCDNLEIEASSASTDPQQLHTAGEIPLDLSRAVCDLTDIQKQGESLFGTNIKMSEETRAEIEAQEAAERSSNTGSPASSTASTILNMHQLFPLQSPLSRPNKRFRTQMSRTQVKILKSVFSVYKTPTMTECDSLGNEIGLSKRVVQVWFQNARAKCKKHMQSQGVELEQPSVTPEECRYCNFRYGHKYAVQDHVFTRAHIDNVRAAIEGDQKREATLEDCTSTGGVVGSTGGIAGSSIHTSAASDSNDALGLAGGSRNMPALLLRQLYESGDVEMYRKLAASVSTLNHQDGLASGLSESVSGTPLHMLQIPGHAAAELRSSLLLPGVSRASFSQDGLSASGLDDVEQTEGETGAICKHCHLVFGSLSQLERHQQQLPLSCGSQKAGALLLTQLLYRCQLCEQQMDTRTTAAAHLAREHGRPTDTAGPSTASPSPSSVPNGRAPAMGTVAPDKQQ